MDLDGSRTDPPEAYCQNYTNSQTPIPELHSKNLLYVIV